MWFPWLIEHYSYPPLCCWLLQPLLNYHSPVIVFLWKPVGASCTVGWVCWEMDPVRTECGSISQLWTEGDSSGVPWGDGVLCNSGSLRKHPGLGIWELRTYSIGIHGKLCSSSVGTTALQSGWKEKWPLLLPFSLGRHFPCTHGLPTICHLHLTVEKDGASKSKVVF